MDFFGFGVRLYGPDLWAYREATGGNAAKIEYEDSWTVPSPRSYRVLAGQTDFSAWNLTSQDPDLADLDPDDEDVTTDDEPIDGRVDDEGGLE